MAAAREGTAVHHSRRFRHIGSCDFKSNVPARRAEIAFQAPRERQYFCNYAGLQPVPGGRPGGRSQVCALHGGAELAGRFEEISKRAPSRKQRREFIRSAFAEYELRVGDVRVFYRVRGELVEVVLIGVKKSNRL